MGATRVIVLDNTDWRNPIGVATLCLCAVTLLLGVVTAVMVFYTRRSVRAAEGAQADLTRSTDAALAAAEAGSHQAAATEELVAVTGEAMRRGWRPILVYAGYPPAVAKLHGTHTTCTLRLTNLGEFAVVDEGNVLGIGVLMRAAPDLTWHGSNISERLVPSGGEIEIKGATPTLPQGVPPSPPAIYVRVRYSDIHAERETTTYLCLGETLPGWEVVGQAIDTGRGQPLRTGYGWRGFIPMAGDPPWPD